MKYLAIVSTSIFIKQRSFPDCKNSDILPVNHMHIQFQRVKIKDIAEITCYQNASLDIYFSQTNTENNSFGTTGGLAE